MEFGVLGPVAAQRDGRDLPLGGPKQRALLAMLLLGANKVVSRDRLIDGLWGERPPPTAGHTLDNYVSRLRKALGEGRVARRAPGYVLRVDPHELDLDRFEQLLAKGRAQLAQGEARRAAETLGSALGLWRGPALADLLYEPFAQGEAGRLEERRLIALEDRIDAELALGHGAELVPELEALVREHPSRERLLGHLMLALYRAGRQAEALALLQSARRRLAEDLGLEPGPELRELQRRILEHDPTLVVPRRPRGPVPWKLPVRRRTATAIAIAAAAVVASAVVGIVVGTRGTSASGPEADSSGLVGLELGSAERSIDVSLAGAPAAMVAGHGSLWLADPGSGSVSRVDVATGAVVDRIPVGGNPTALALGGGSVWAASVAGDRLVRIDPTTGTITQTVGLDGGRAGAVAFGAERLWVADLVGRSLIGVEPDSGAVARRIPLDFRPTALAVGEHAIWASDYSGRSVVEVDVRTGRSIARVHVGNGPSSLAVAPGAVWVANSLDSTVSRVDPISGSVVATLAVGSGPTAVVVADGSVWVASQYSRSVSRIDPERNSVVQTVTMRRGPTTLAATDGRVWAGVRPLVQHRGGTLVLLHQRPISIDPALHLDLLPLVSDRLTRNGLVAYNLVPGPAGTHLVPDLAISLPVPTYRDTTYTFRLRPGIRYSDGRPLHAEDFRRAIERLFRLDSPGRTLFDGIRGAERCDRRACDLSPGVVIDEAARTVTFRLQAPDPDFLGSLTVAGLATPVPPGTPFRDTGFEPIPGTGPYKIARASRREIRYVRNPFFREWSHAARPDGNPDEIVMRFGLTPEQQVRAIQEGRADWMADFIPAKLLPGVRARFASQLHRISIPTTDFLRFNTRLPPFHDSRVRRAVSFAIDRRAIARIYGGRDFATPTCQVLPPGIAGYRPYCPYTRKPRNDGAWTGPDLSRARRLVAASGTRGAPITVWGATDHPAIRPQVIRYTAAVLRRVGFRARVRLVPDSFFARRPDIFEDIQLVPVAWGDTPYGFFSTWFSCRGARNRGWFCDRRLDRAALRAQALRATDPRAAAALWARIDRALVDRAAAAPFVNEHGLDFVSNRVRNYQFHPYWGLIADQLWIR